MRKPSDLLSRSNTNLTRIQGNGTPNGPTDQRVIMAASASDGLTILSDMPQYLHHLLNTRNATVLQADCVLTYAEQNIYLPKYFCQSLLQVHILVIPNPDVPTGIYPLLTQLEWAGNTNAHQSAMQVQVLLAMGQKCLSKE